jgi:hypothetical protein
LRMAGARRMADSAVLGMAQNHGVNHETACRMIAHVLNSAATTDIPGRELARSSLWYSDLAQPTSLDRLLIENRTIATRQVAELATRGLSQRQLRRYLSSIYTAAEADTLLRFPAAPESSEEETNGQLVNPDTTTPTTTIIRSGLVAKWRTAELLVADLMKNLGYSVEDKSRQNLGYDILAVKDRETMHVEVKSIAFPGQPFMLTPNEESAARQLSRAYSLALVARTTDKVHIQLIPDPLERLTLTRQCRQWVWECSDYTFQSTYTVQSDQTYG